MKRIILCSLFAATFACTASANDGVRTLKGDYAVTGTAACLISAPSATSPGGFDPQLRPIPGSRVWSHSFSVEAIRTFDGAGTGTAKGSAVGIVPPPTPGAPGPFTGPGQFPPSGEAHTFSFAFTYTVDPDGTFHTALVPGTFVGNNTAGPRTGQTFTTDVLSLTGLIANHARTLTLASVVPEVATIVYSNGDRHQQICHRSRVLLKMDDDDDRGGRDDRDQDHR